MSVKTKNSNKKKNPKFPSTDLNMESFENEPCLKRNLERAIEIINKVGLPDWMTK